MLQQQTYLWVWLWSEYRPPRLALSVQGIYSEPGRTVTHLHRYSDTYKTSCSPREGTAIKPWSGWVCVGGGATIHQWACRCVKEGFPIPYAPVGQVGQTATHESGHMYLAR